MFAVILYFVYRTKWPFVCWCVVKNILTAVTAQRCLGFTILFTGRGFSFRLFIRPIRSQTQQL